MTAHARTPVLAVLGPTACGKTALAIALAKTLRGEIVSCDSMQIYKGMDIGTAKPTPEERAAAPHHLIDFLEPEQPFSVHDYVALAGRVIEEIRGRGKLPILCGGTGLYARSLLDGMAFDGFGRNDALRDSLRESACAHGPQALYEQLAALDPPAAEKIHPNNLTRVIRALEYCLSSGERFSDWQRDAREAPTPYDALRIGIGFRDRAALYARIDARVEKMFAAGLVEEARAFYERWGGDPASTAAQAIGYKELFPYFAGERSLEEAKELICRETRRYAKRQLTWLRREPDLHWVWADGNETLQEQCLPFIRQWQKETDG